MDFVKWWLSTDDPARIRAQPAARAPVKSVYNDPKYVTYRPWNRTWAAEPRLAEGRLARSGILRAACAAARAVRPCHHRQAERQDDDGQYRQAFQQKLLTEAGRIRNNNDRPAMCRPLLGLPHAARLSEAMHRPGGAQIPPALCTRSFRFLMGADDHRHPCRCQDLLRIASAEAELGQLARWRSLRSFSVCWWPSRHSRPRSRSGSAPGWRPCLP